MNLGTVISTLRKQQGMTQEALAQKLEVTNQSVSKWEANQCCPDIQLLPRLADIFHVSIDTLFGRESARQSPVLPWEDDGVLRAVLFVGHELVDGHEAAEKIEFCYEGPALNVSSAFSVTCNCVQGSVSAQGSVICDMVAGSVNAGGSVTCDAVGRDVHAGGNITCDDVGGHVQSGGNITCDSIGGNASAGNDIRCDEICGGHVSAGGSIYCDHMEL